jgi:membrane fusion protein (multidrug efflux system)
MSETRKNKRSLIIGMGVFFALIGLAGGGWWWYNSSKLVSTDDARISGTIVSVSSKIGGRITEVLVKEGDTVQAGQVIARIDARDTTAQKAQAEAALAAARAKYDEMVAGTRPQEIEQARAGVEQAQAGVEQARANFENAEKNYERVNKLYADGALSAAQRDNAKAAYLTAREAVNAARNVTSGASQKLDLMATGSREETIRAAAAQVKQAEAALETAELADEYTTILSPNEGIVALKSVNPGEMVSAGQALFSVVDSKDIWLNARIEETKIGKLALGQKVDYTIDGYSGRTFSGTIYEIGIATNSTFALIPTENSSGNFTKVTQRIPIKITLPDNMDGVVFRPGMQAVIDIHLQ